VRGSFTNVCLFHCLHAALSRKTENVINQVFIKKIILVAVYAVSLAEFRIREMRRNEILQICKGALCFNKTKLSRLTLTSSLFKVRGSIA